MAANPFRGGWRLTHMDQWDDLFIDLVVPGFFRFDATSGEFAFGTVAGEMDCKLGKREGEPVIEWTWAGHDEEDEASGRGWARLDGKSKLVGHLYFHMGEDSAFEATRSRARQGR